MHTNFKKKKNSNIIEWIKKKIKKNYINQKVLRKIALSRFDVKKK